MTCQSIMTVHPPVLRPDDTVRTALKLLVSQRILAAPVVDQDGRYTGMFGKRRLFSLLLPTVVAIDEVLPNIAHLPDLAFLPDDLGAMRDRLKAVADHPVAEYVDKTVPVLRPDSPLMAAVLLLYRTRNFIPVVEERTGRLVGVVSSWDTLGRIGEDL